MIEQQLAKGGQGADSCPSSVFPEPTHLEFN